MRMTLESLMFATIFGVTVSPMAFADPIQCQHPPAQIIVLRHGCKVNGADASPLCASGWAQAVELIDRMGKYDIGTIYVTDKPRSVETASALAKCKGLTPVTLQATKPATRKLVEEVCSKPGGKDKAILYVGHADTMGSVLEAFGFPYKAPNYGEGWIISFEGGKPTLKDIPASNVQCDKEECAPRE